MENQNGRAVKIESSSLTQCICTCLGSFWPWRRLVDWRWFHWHISTKVHKSRVYWWLIPSRMKSSNSWLTSLVDSVTFSTCFMDDISNGIIIHACQPLWTVNWGVMSSNSRHGRNVWRLVLPTYTSLLKLNQPHGTHWPYNASLNIRRQDHKGVDWQPTL